jgi:hypothetical protein
VTEAPNILWEPNSEPQKAFLRSTARHCLIGGGNASGKTSALLAASAMQSANPKHRAIIFRRDYPSLKHIISASYALFLPMRAVYSRSDHTWTWPSGSTLEFSHLEDEAAVFQHSGKQYSFIGFDELTQLPADATDSRGNPINSAFAFMQTRLRADADSGLSLECRATASPSGPGMSWVKNFYQIPDSGESSEFVHPVTKFRHQYVRALASQNPAISAADYERQMADLPAAQRKALLYGDWTALTGAIFPEWSYDLHTCEPFSIPASWQRWRSCDDGYAAPACVLWLVWDKDVTDTIYVIREIYERGLTPEALAANIKQLDGDEPWKGVIDSSAFANTGTGSGSRGAAMNRLGCNWRAVEKGPGSRASGLHAIHQRLAKRDDGSVGLKIFRGCCPNLVRTLPALVYSTKNPEEIDSSCEDHSVDCLRYGVIFRPLTAGRVRVM